MWQPTKITLKNFYSHKDSTYEFRDGLSLIYGLNKDDAGANSNGAGKSTIIQAVTVALLGTTMRGITKDDFIKDGEKECEVIFTLSNSILGKELSIQRTFKRSGTGVVVLRDAQGELKQITGVPEANTYILSELGLQKEDLLNFFILNQDNESSFFTAGDAKQKELIARLADFTVLDSLVEKVGKTIKELESESVAKNKEGLIVSTKIETFEGLLKKEVEEGAQEIQKKIEWYKVQILNLEAEIVKSHKEDGDLREVIKDFEFKIKECEDDINSCEGKIKECQGKIESGVGIEQEILEVKKLLRECDDVIVSNNNKLKHKIECPLCKGEFLNGMSDDLEDVRTNIKELGALKTNIQTQITELHSKYTILGIDALKEGLKRLNEDLNRLNDALKKLKVRKVNINDDIYGCAKRIKSNENLIITHRQNILTIEKEQNTDKVDKLRGEISTLNNNKDGLNERLGAIDLDLKKYKETLLLFGRQGFSTYLANKVIKVIQNSANYYLSGINTNLEVRIEGFTKLASGEFRDKIEISIARDNDVVSKFERFSGGEKSRINICGVLALHSLINNSLEGRGLNLLCLDETVENLDGDGQYEVLKVLEKSGIRTLIVSHGSENLNYSNRVIVQKEQGVSKIL